MPQNVHLRRVLTAGAALVLLTSPSIGCERQTANLIDAVSTAVAGRPLPPDERLVETARDDCLGGHHTRRDLPLILQDRRDTGYAALLFADGATLITCRFRADPSGTYELLASGEWDAWVPGADVSIEDGYLGRRTSSFLGTVPIATGDLRIVVDTQVISASVRDGFAGVSWSGASRPMLAVAFDANGDALAWLGSEELAVAPWLTCPPEAVLGCHGEGPIESLWPR